jgi:hypothetical protein
MLLLLSENGTVNCLKLNQGNQLYDTENSRQSNFFRFCSKFGSNDIQQIHWYSIAIDYRCDD